MAHLGVPRIFVFAVAQSEVPILGKPQLLHSCGHLSYRDRSYAGDLFLTCYPMCVKAQNIRKEQCTIGIERLAESRRIGSVDGSQIP